MAILKENYLKIRNIQKLSEVDETVDFILDIVGAKNLGDTEEEHAKNISFIYNFIMDKFHMLTLEEIKEAFRMYVANKFEVKVFRILDCVVVGEVLNSYIEFRNNQLQSYKPEPIEKPKLDIITNSAKEEINKKAVNRVFNEFKEQKTLPDGLGYIYDILVEHGKIKLAAESTPKLSLYYKNKIEQSRNELLAEKKSELRKEESRFNVSGVNSVKEALKKIENGNNTEINLRVKKLVLKDFFNKSILGNLENIF